ncbi:uncharacterized protein LOC127241656 [Andrographis paniculata]|uniref:uncharacterized protein LOC127241656 n=1 Tax=Andrographis paniculata TaxID=175694 RepID=UPI0021E8B305|nr:uncharacterized protein LOC127241656 [Andrographis paniculata]
MQIVSRLSNSAQLGFIHSIERTLLPAYITSSIKSLIRADGDGHPTFHFSLYQKNYVWLNPVWVRRQPNLGSAIRLNGRFFQHISLRRLKASFKRMQIVSRLSNSEELRMA